MMALLSNISVRTLDIGGGYVLALVGGLAVRSLRTYMYVYYCTMLSIQFSNQPILHHVSHVGTNFKNFREHSTII